MKNLNKYINAVMAFLDKIGEKISNISFLNINPGKKTIAIVFSIVVVLIATVSGVFVVSEITEEDPTAPSDDVESTQAVSFITDDQELQGNFLFALTYGEKLNLLGVIRVDSAERSMRVSFLSGDTYCAFDNLSGTMSEHYNNGGVTELLLAVEEYADISIERYILADESNFTDLMDHIGEMTVNLEHDIICGQDAASFIIEEGQQTLIPAMMVKYFYYLCENQPEYNYETIDTMALYSKKLFCSGDEEETQSNFDYMISCLETNISALDFNNYKAPILSLADPAVLDNIAIEEDISNLKG